MHPPYRLNPALIGFSCLRCEAPLPIGDYFEGCPACLKLGEPASVRPVYQTPSGALVPLNEPGMLRYAPRMPYSSWVSLGEGRTPCIGTPALAQATGVSAIFIKSEAQNPSGSHKDRMSCLTVTRAVDIGATRIVAASSGNGGASIALYAAAAGLDCRVVATAALSPIHKRAIVATGAEIVTASESLERWQILAAMVDDGWFPATNYLNPPVGSNPYGVAGLKAIAYEIAEQCGTHELDAVIVPTSRGDLLWGIYDGFRDLFSDGLIRSIPRLYAVEPFPRLSRVLDGENRIADFPGTTALASIGGSTITYQALAAIRASGGGAITVGDDQAARDQRRLAAVGWYLELSSAAALSGLENLVSAGRIAPSETVVLVATSHGYKDMPAASAT